MRVMGRLAESEDPVLFARFGEVDKCEFIKVNTPVEAWASTEDGLGLLVKTSGLREQAREVLVSAVRAITPYQPATPALRMLARAPLLLAPGPGCGHGCGTQTDATDRPTALPSPPFSGARLAACGDEEACGGDQERDEAGTLSPRRSRDTSWEPVNTPTTHLGASLARGGAEGGPQKEDGAGTPPSHQ